MRKHLFSVTLDDCHVTCFTVGGNGGSGKDTSNTGIRIVHRASGAVGEGREFRSQRQNKVAAFRRMAETPTFQTWARAQAAKLQGEPSIDQQVERWMDPAHLVIEGRSPDGGWMRID